MELRGWDGDAGGEVMPVPGVKKMLIEVLGKQKEKVNSWDLYHLKEAGKRHEKGLLS